jgi:hypothetical protein
VAGKSWPREGNNDEVPQWGQLLPVRSSEVLSITPQTVEVFECSVELDSLVEIIERRWWLARDDASTHAQ